MERPKISDPSPKTWVVVGPKRSGTSFLARVLGDNGVEIAHCGNGHNEDIDFVRFNNMILNEAGGDWNFLPPDEDIAKAVEANRDRLVELIESKKNGSAWGWKDPRQGAVLKHILPYLDDDVYLVCVFRKPAKVAESINRTWPQHSVEFGKRVALDYYRRILDAVEEFIK
jgi:hypothetical protein